MIIWIASYPKSGNTYLRSFLASYYFSENGKFNFDQLIKLLSVSKYETIKLNQRQKKRQVKDWIFNQNTFFNKNNLNLVKTHNCLLPFEGNKFTSKKETLGAIYIVRDPRNIITSMTHHYSLDYENALNYMLDENSSLLEKSHEEDHSNFTYLNSWSNHYKSWKNNYDFETLFIKYEDLAKNKEEIFKKIILFVDQIVKKKFQN